MKNSIPVAVLALVLFASRTSAADLRLARHFADHMVLQRDKPLVLRGWADGNAAVRVEFAGQKRAATADESGQWQVTLDPLPANSRPQNLVVGAGRSRIVVRDVVVGDVILFARQTTVDITLGRDEAGREAAAAHKVSPRFRAMTLRVIPAPKPLDDLAAEATTGWRQVDAEQALSMSASAYLLGRDLSAVADVPVGVIDLNMGWHFPIAWLSRDALLETPDVYGGSSVKTRVARMEARYEAFTTGKPLGKKKEIVKEDPLGHPLFPAAGYNAIIHPLRGIGLKGLIVQLGNDYPYMYYNKLKTDGTQTDRDILNETYIKTYDIRKEGFRMEPAVVTRIPREWRKALGDPSLPLSLVNPPSSELWPFAVHNREMREVQRLVAMEDPATSLILPGMEAVPFSGQPRDEALLAARSLKWALGALYKENDTPATGPLYERFEGTGNNATIHFRPGTARGLKAADGALDHFEVANVEAEYVPAEAVIDGETIQLTCDDISRIFHIRYNWRETPDQGLVNSARLPAVPFRTEKAGHRWLVRHKEDDLPAEYSTPANTWKGGAVTLINGQLQKVGYLHFSGWLGPLGVKTGPFGPNMGVREVLKGSPADGRLFEGDVIYSVNGRMLGEEEEQVMSAAITESETEAMGGKLTLGVHREGKNLDVELTLPVMGRYSATAPWDCLKTERIVANLEGYLARRGRPGGFLYTDALFLLGAGSPEYQGLVRETVAGHLDGKGPGSNWHLGYLTILLSEYYLATGDRRVLPRIKRLADTMAEVQIKEDGGRRCGGWYGRGFSARAYPAMVHAGISCMLGMTLAKEAGVEVDEGCYRRGLNYLERKGAPMGVIIYGDAFRSKPQFLDPQEMLSGRLKSGNGKMAEAAILYRLLGDERSAYINSLISTHAWYSTYDGHGGNFWNNFWTPLGASVHGKPSMVYFMKGHRWYRECHRMYDGSLITSQNDRRGAGPGLALVVPRRRLRILGAPKSPFSPGAPEALKEALAAYEARDYEHAETLANALIAEAKVDKSEEPTVRKLAEEAKRMRESMAADLAGMEALINRGRLHQAGLILASLTPVIAENDPRLAAIREQLRNGKARDRDEELYKAELKAGGPQETGESTAKSAADLKKMEEKKKKAAARDGKAGNWECLTPKEFIPKKKGSKPGFGTAPADKATRWRLTVLESRTRAPEGWMKPGFDDSEWTTSTHPISWHLNHVALLRTTFAVKDRKTYDLLRFRSWLFRQQNVAIYLNGVLIGRINNLEKKTGTLQAEFKKGALDALKDGENTLAIATRQNWRWGMLSMRVYNGGGFDFMLDARQAEDGKRD